MLPLIAFAMLAVIVAICFAVPALIFMLAWNAVMPKFWHAAPHLSFWYAWGAWWLLGMLRGRVSATATVEKEKKP